MKKTLTILAAVLFTALQSRGEILAGPITNPENGHNYYLLTPNSWTASEAEAESLGGTLAIVKNAEESKWIFSQFCSYGGISNRNLWIGLRRESQGGPFMWVTGAKPAYTNWGPGEPDNCGGNESYVHYWNNNEKTTGMWNDAANDLNLNGSAPNGVVEVLGKKDFLSDKEKSLVGEWHEGGNQTRPCYIVATQNVLFQIYDGRAVRLSCNDDGLYLFNGIRGEIAQDKILWSNGTWWSRTPVTYQR